MSKKNRDKRRISTPLESRSSRRKVRVSETPFGRVPLARMKRRRSRRLLTSLGVAAALVLLFAAAILGTAKKSPARNRLRSGLAPAFVGQNLVNGQTISSKSAFKKGNTLLFFSEGVMCQACFEQIQSLERVSKQLAARHLNLISITTDPTDVLRQAVSEYRLHTPMISDWNRKISDAYQTLGLGMHPDTDGHTFILVDRHGNIRWRHDYTTMYVPPEQLLKSIPNLT
jgi:peroxiredoxin